MSLPEKTDRDNPDQRPTGRGEKWGQFLIQLLDLVVRIIMMINDGGAS